LLPILLSVVHECDDIQIGRIQDFNLQQCDVIFKLKHFQLHALLIIPNDITLPCKIHEDLKDIFFIGIDQN
jgi:hypothetical protein